MDLLFIAFIALIGSFIQSASGFGYAILCMALGSLILPFRVVTIVEVITAFAMVLYISIKLYKHINFKLMLFPLISSLAASTLGVFTLMASTETLMRRVLGVALIVLSIYFIFFSAKIRIKPTPINGLIAGAISGFFGGLFNIGGPPIVAYFLSVTDDKMEYNATLQCYFAFTTVYIFFMHLFLGNVTGEVIKYSLVGLIGVGLGVGGGLNFFKKLSLNTIKKMVYSFMVIAGLYMLFTS